MIGLSRKNRVYQAATVSACDRIEFVDATAVAIRDIELSSRQDDSTDHLESILYLSGGGAERARSKRRCAGSHQSPRRGHRLAGEMFSRGRAIISQDKARILARDKQVSGSIESQGKRMTQTRVRDPVRLDKDIVKAVLAMLVASAAKAQHLAVFTVGVRDIEIIVRTKNVRPAALVARFSAADDRRRAPFATSRRYGNRRGMLFNSRRSTTMKADIPLGFHSSAKRVLTD
jgi:hypothetical protein